MTGVQTCALPISPPPQFNLSTADASAATAAVQLFVDISTADASAATAYPGEVQAQVPPRVP